MTELLAVITPFLLIDMVNPVLFAVLIYAAGSPQPLANSSAMLLGHTLAYFVVGLLASIGIENLIGRLGNPQPIDFVIESILAVGLLYAALASRKGGASKERNPDGILTPMKCLVSGAILNFVGAPFALPYLAVVGKIMQADLSAGEVVSVLLTYNLAYAAPFALVPLLIYFIGDKAKPFLAKANDLLAKGADLLMPWLMLALAAWLLFDVYTYITTGAPLQVAI